MTKDSKASKQSIINFMKKNSTAKNNPQSLIKNSQQKIDSKKIEQEEQEQKEVDEAKKTSKAKAQQFNQSMMTNRLITQNIVKNVMLITLLVGATLGLIHFTPIFFKFLHNLIGTSILEGSR